MYLLTSLVEPDSTKAALLRAALELLAEKGYTGATTRAIAAKAGVSEVTLFRHFASKKELMREAINRLEPPFDQLAPLPSEDMEAGLRQLVQNLSTFLEANKGFMVRLLPELLRHPELRGEGPALGYARTFATGAGLMQRYQQAGVLKTQESPEQLVLALIGPLVARVLMGGAWGIELSLDTSAYVKGFLEGRKHG